MTKSLTAGEELKWRADRPGEAGNWKLDLHNKCAASTRNAQPLAFSACLFLDFQASFHAIEAQAVTCRFPVDDDHTAMRGDPGRKHCGSNLIPSARFEGSRELAAYSAVLAVEAIGPRVALCGLPLEPIDSSAFLRVRTSKARYCATRWMLVAVCSGLSDGSRA